MEHGIGLQSSIWNNNMKSTALLVGFPFVICLMVWAILFGTAFTGNSNNGQPISPADALMAANLLFMQVWWIIFAVIGGWFGIAWFSHQRIINKATHARPMERKENPEVYNLLENLCISRGLKTPKLFVIDSDAMNAYASGISESTYSVTLTRGIINALNKEELEAVIAHELTHIMNRDVRLLIISVIFVGIISVIAEMLVRGALRGGSSRSGGSKKNPAAIIIVIAIAAVGYLLSILIRFALSRRREYLADAGAVQLTKNAPALISALEKISGHSDMADVDSDVKQMMFDNQASFLGIFATHPPIDKRIEVLRNY